MVEEARQSVFLTDYRAPDTLDRRFGLICLHAFLYLHRLGAEQLQANRLYQSFFDRMFADFDRTLRGMGTGDLSGPAPEFSRTVPLHQIGGKPFLQRIEATAEERERLSRRVDLVALHRLVAEVELRRQNAEIIFLEAKFEAEFEQWCVITLEPVRGAVSERFSLIYGPASEEEKGLILRGDEPAFEPLRGDAIDIGEAVAQELSLALPEFPRDSDAVIDDVELAQPLEGPFASLARLRTRPEC